MTTATVNRKRKRKGPLKGFASGLKWLAGIASSVAAIMTAATTVLGLVVHHQDTQLRHANARTSTQNRQISQQQQQIQRLQSKLATASRSPKGSGPAGGNAAPSGVAHFLSSLSPTVDNDGVNSGQQVIAAKSYPDTVTWGCGDSSAPNEAYDVAGNSVFTAEVGIPDNTQYVTGVVATVTFSNESGQQIGQPVQVSLGHPASVRLNIKGVTQLGMTCTGRNRQTSQPTDTTFSVALGNGGVS